MIWALIVGYLLLGVVWCGIDHKTISEMDAPSGMYSEVPDFPIYGCWSLFLWPVFALWRLGVRIEQAKRGGE